MNSPLVRQLLAEAQHNPGIRRSNVGGWHSAPDLAQRPDPAIRAVLQAIVDGVGELARSLADEAGIRPAGPWRYAVTAWAMVMRDGDYITPHDHGGSHFSAVYYVDAGEPAPEHPESGRLVLVDPRRGARPIDGLDLFASTHAIEPRTGLLVIFPGYLQHYVHPYRGTTPRVSIACNVNLELAPPPIRPAARPG